MGQNRDLVAAAPRFGQGVSDLGESALPRLPPACRGELLTAGRINDVAGCWKHLRAALASAKERKLV